MRLSRQLSFKKASKKKDSDTTLATNEKISPPTPERSNSQPTIQSPLSRFAYADIVIAPENQHAVAQLLINDKKILSILNKSLKSLDELGEASSALTRIASKLGHKAQFLEQLLSLEISAAIEDDLNNIFFHESLLTKYVDHILLHPRFRSTREMLLLPITPILSQNSISFELDPYEIERLVLNPNSSLINNYDSRTFKNDRNTNDSSNSHISNEALVELIEKNMSSLINYAHLFIVGLCDNDKIPFPQELLYLGMLIESHLSLLSNENAPTSQELKAKLFVSRLLSTTNLESGIGIFGSDNLDHENSFQGNDSSFIDRNPLSPDKRKNLAILREVLENIATQRLYNEKAGQKIILNNFMQAQMGKFTNFLSSLTVSTNDFEFNSGNDLDFDENYKLDIDLKKVTSIILDHEKDFLQSLNYDSKSLKHLLETGEYLLQNNLINTHDNLIEDEKASEIRSLIEEFKQNDIPIQSYALNNENNGVFIQITIGDKHYSGYVYPVQNDQVKYTQNLYESEYDSNNKKHIEPLQTSYISNTQEDSNLHSEISENLPSHHSGSMDIRSIEEKSFKSNHVSEAVTHEATPSSKISSNPKILTEEIIDPTSEDENFESLPHNRFNEEHKQRLSETTKVQIPTEKVQDSPKPSKRLSSVLSALKKLSVLDTDEEIEKIVSAGGTEKVLKIAEKYANIDEPEVSRAVALALFHLTQRSEKARKIVSESKNGIEAMFKYVTTSSLVELDEIINGFQSLRKVSENELGLAKIRGGGLGINLLFNVFKRFLLKITSDSSSYDQIIADSLIFSFFNLYFYIETSESDSVVPFHFMIAILSQSIQSSNFALASSCIELLQSMCLGSSDYALEPRPQLFNNQQSTTIIKDAFIKILQSQYEGKFDSVIALTNIINVLLLEPESLVERAKLVYFIFAYLHSIYVKRSDIQLGESESLALQHLCKLLEQLSTTDNSEVKIEFERAYKVIIAGIERSSTFAIKLSLSRLLLSIISNAGKEFENAFISNQGVESILNIFEIATQGDLLLEENRRLIYTLLVIQIEFLNRFKTHEKNLKKQLKSIKNVNQIKSLKKCYEDSSVIAKARELAGRIGAKF